MKPTIGRIVHYRLTAADAEQINRRRTTRAEIAKRIAANTCKVGEDYAGTASYWPLGAQAHIGHPANAGDVLPMMITYVCEYNERPNDLRVNGQVFLDGNDTLWVTGILAHREGTKPDLGEWAWPKREE